MPDTTSTMTIAIGRNHRDSHGFTVAMDDETWNGYKKHVRAYFDVLYAESDALGQYEGDEEESCLFLGTTTIPQRQVRSELAELASDYDQESIGLVAQEGVDTLVYANRRGDKVA